MGIVKKGLAVSLVTLKSALPTVVMGGKVVVVATQNASCYTQCYVGILLDIMNALMKIAP